MVSWLSIFSYAFIRRALIVGLCTSLSSSLLGVTLVLKRYSMIGDGLSHVAFGALAVSLALGWSPLTVSLPVVVIAAFVLLRFTYSGSMAGDTSIAMISGVSLAIGVVASGLSKGMNSDVSGYMFGSILALTPAYVAVGILLSIAVVLTFVLGQGRIFSLTFDESFSKATGVPVDGFTLILAGLTALNVVIGIRIMGALLISSLIVFPPVIAMRWSKSFKGVVILSGIISMVGFVIGFWLSNIYSIATGASVVLILALIYIITILVSSWRKPITRRP
ncbi:MAG: metal ABC transporter permease [Tissierellia bacterium]|nr:metal ABC transporter permease [Tissierellia bacterium]